MKLFKALLILGGILAPFLIGGLITVCSMISAFRDLADKGISDPKVLAGRIGDALIATWVGVACSAALLVIALGYVLLKRGSKPRLN